MIHENTEPLSELELLELGRQVETDPMLDGFERQGRTITNLEMFAAIQFRRDQRRKANDLLRDL